MKFIQSYWSKPSTEDGSAAMADGKRCGGWPSERYHAMSWALSCLQLATFYGKIDLVTDREGASWLIDECGLPYDTVSVELNCLDGFNSSLWALSKIYTYSIQTTPFIHVDSDVYIWRPFPEEVVQAPLVVQNIEQDPDLPVVMRQIRHDFIFIPEYLRHIDPASSIPSINAGIIGGHLNSFFRKYAEEALAFVKRNEACYQHLNLNHFNLVYEQVLFYHYARSQGLCIDTLLTDVGKRYAAVLKLNLVPQKSSYIHMIGYAKKNELACRQLEGHFRYLYPKEYRHIRELYKEVGYYGAASLETGSLPLSGLAFAEFLAVMGEAGASIGNPYGSQKNPGDVIEEILELYFGDKRSWRLSDVYQLERALQEIDTVAACPDYGLSYTLSIPEFLNLPLELNTGKCRILYLYYAWEQLVSADKIAMVIKEQVILQETGDHPTYLISAKEGQFVLEGLAGWNIIFSFLEDERLTGYELLRMIHETGRLAYTGGNMEEDLYDFLTFQVFGTQNIRTCGGG